MSCFLYVHLAFAFPFVYVCSLFCALLDIFSKKTFVKMKLKSSSSLSEPEMRAKLLSQVREENLKSIYINDSSFKRSVHFSFSLLWQNKGFLP